MSNLDRAHDLVYSKHADIVLISETWLNGNILDQDLFPLSLFIVYRKDRKDRNCGGFLIAVKGNSFKSMQEYVPDSENLEDLELVCAEMTTFCNKKVLFCSIYWPDPHPHTHPTLHEQEIPVEMVLTSIKQLDIYKATGSDEIPMRLLKETANQIAPSLTMLFNKSLRLGIFPEEWKLANIVPIFKKGKRDFVENYRPIFLLPVISKVLERCVLAGQRATYPTSSAANSMAFKPVDLV